MIQTGNKTSSTTFRFAYEISTGSSKNAFVPEKSTFLCGFSANVQAIDLKTALTAQLLDYVNV